MCSCPHIILSSGIHKCVYPLTALALSPRTSVMEFVQTSIGLPCILSAWSLPYVMKTAIIRGENNPGMAAILMQHFVLVPVLEWCH